MTNITSIQQLLDTLTTCSGKEFVGLVKRLELTADDFTPYMSWSKDTYTRNCIDRTDRYELLLLCWEADQVTPIHCHGGEECWVMMVDGKIKEHRYDECDDNTLKLSQVLDIEHHQISYMNDDMGLHRLSNVGSKRAMSLHLYMDPIDKCTVYNEADGSRSERILSYHTDARLIAEATTC